MVLNRSVATQILAKLGSLGGLGAMAIVVWCIATGLTYGQDTYTLEEDGWEISSDPIEVHSPQAELRAVHRLLAEDRVKEALKAADAWIKEHTGHALTVDAYLLRADVKVAMRWYYKALYDYEAVIRDYPASSRYLEAMEREFEIAKMFASGLKRRFLGMRIISAAGDAEEIFIRIQERSPGSELGEKASWALGNFYYDRAQMTTAVEAYDLFLTNYPRSSHREQAMMRLIESSLATFRGPNFDPTGLIDAAQWIKTFQQQYPAAARRMDAQSLTTRIDELLALKMVHTGRWYEQRGERISAVTMYRQAVREYPQTAASATAIRRLKKLGADVIPKNPANQPGKQGVQAAGDSEAAASVESDQVRTDTKEIGQ